MDEFKEKKIGDKVFQIKKKRSFVAQGDLEMYILPGRNEVPKYRVVIADCKIEELEKGPHGNVVGKKYRDVTMDDMESLTDEQGDELYLEVLKFRFGDVLNKLKKKLQKSKKKEKESIGKSKI